MSKVVLEQSGWAVYKCGPEAYSTAEEVHQRLAARVGKHDHLTGSYSTGQDWCVCVCVFVCVCVCEAYSC